MKQNFSLLLLFVFSVNAFTQNLQTIFTDKISIRAIELYDGKVWYAGSGSKFGYVDLKNPDNRQQTVLSDQKLEFRTLAQDRNSFIAINVGAPAHFYRIDKRTMKATVINTDTAETAFYDALHFHNGLFYTFSDPDKRLGLQFSSFVTDGDQFIQKKYSDYKMLEGEAAFAASNTNIAASKNFLWLATGGNASRIFRLNLKTKKIEIFATPFVQGTPSQGMYSIDFFKDKFGIAVGGDYTKQQENANNIATTRDAGRTWQIEASGANAGYSTCVRIRPGSRGRDIIAVGDRHISLSRDYGKTWKVISEEKGFYVAEWTDRKNIVLAGNGKIAKMKVF